MLEGEIILRGVPVSRAEVEISEKVCKIGKAAYKHELARKMINEEEESRR